MNRKTFVVIAIILAAAGSAFIKPSSPRLLSQGWAAPNCGSTMPSNIDGGFNCNWGVPGTICTIHSRWAYANQEACYANDLVFVLKRNL